MAGCPAPYRVLLAALCLSALSLGCEPTAVDIARWKQTEKGPGKLRAALQGKALPPEIRAQAAAALIDIGRGEEVEADLGEAPEPARRAVIHLLTPQLISLLQNGPADAAPVRSQLEAKDGLFRLRLLGEPDDRRAAEEALVAFCVNDLPGRMSAGTYGTERVLLAIGGRAQGPLLAVLRRAALGTPALLPAASLLGRIGDPEARRGGVEHLVRLIRPVLAPATPKGRSGGALSDGLRALGLLGGPTAAVFLKELVETGTKDTRQRAFVALRETGDAAALDLALRIAWDKREDGGVREAAFAYLEKIGQIAVGGLCQIIKDPRDASERGDTARFRAVEAALTAGGVGAIRPVLSALPIARSYSREDLIAFVVHQLTPLGSAGRPAVTAALQDPSWVAKAAAILALSEMGEAADGAALLALEGDRTKLLGAGWPATLGDLAREQAERLRQKSHAHPG